MDGENVKPFFRFSLLMFRFYEWSATGISFCRYNLLLFTVIDYVEWAKCQAHPWFDLYYRMERN